MKVLFLGAAVSNHTLRWINSLSDRGHDVLLVCRGDQKAENINIGINDKVKIRYLRFGGGAGYYLNALELRSIYKKFQPDVVNAHYATGYGTLARIAKVRPLVISFWGSDIYEYPYKNKLNWKLLLKNIQYADAIAATSVAMANKIKEVYPTLKKKITVTPFGVDTSMFAPEIREKNARPAIGIVKYLKEIYDIPLLIHAFAIIMKESDLHPVLQIYGGGPLLTELQELCKELEIQDSVTFYGTIPNTDIPKAINKMDVFVNCSVRESFGVALVEAMACEVPVVATDTEGFREVVDNGVTGIILDDRDPRTMADAIQFILLHPEIAQKYGENGRKRVLALYDWNENVGVMEKLYESISNKN